LVAATVTAVADVIRGYEALLPSAILRRLGTYSRKNRLYFAFRELGRAIRTAFLLRYIGSVDLRSELGTASREGRAAARPRPDLWQPPDGEGKERGLAGGSLWLISWPDGDGHSLYLPFFRLQCGALAACWILSP